MVEKRFEKIISFSLNVVVIEHYYLTYVLKKRLTESNQVWARGL